ncbi:coiled coil domain-containing protein [Naegleria gruberi]|uniref:Coiled coil domain-containing protein n=1 Tax=Naegleria gruberi TaxID=5762 RepID=D2VDN1_NAEGR|nr:coiled coil domain-containing protein [Naegleria gruberi]EFC44926.1 coiled coil domain-containing protein [Naegleria gruberi]|eukprot:XP_002677670.1 coiled coil domain-containing protein [Naegleria gruberi strain NEG-M]
MVVKTERMSLSSVIQQMNQRRNFSQNNTNRGSSGHHEQEHKQHTKKTEFEELDDVLPEPPKREVLLAKIAGASAMFWILYKMRQDGLIVFGLEKPHWEHAMEDDESDRDDEYFENALQEDEESLDLKIEYHLSKPESNFDKKFDILKLK